MRFRIPPQHKETVTVVRKSAYESDEETTVAEDVVCMVQPLLSSPVQRDALEFRIGRSGATSRDACAAIETEFAYQER